MEACLPPTSILPSMDDLPYLEDVEVHGSHVQSIAHQWQGGAGLGGCDASHWRDILLWYGASSASVCSIVATLWHRLCNIIISWEDYRALVASPLIVLDKCPGIGPIGIDETLHRIVGKTICLATCIDVTVAFGSDQLCAGLSSVIEGAIHASPYGWGVLMVDASNFF